MASTLACVGLGVESAADLGDLIDAMTVEDHGRADGVRVLRHVDDGGARVVVGVRDGDVLDLVPSVDAPIGALLGSLRRDGDHAVADVLEPDSGEMVTRMAFDLEQVRCLPLPEHAAAIPDGVQWPAAVVAHGVDVTVHPDVASFDATESGFAAESFVSYGLFAPGEREGDDDGDQAGSEPTAWLAGIVLDVETRTTAVTGQGFHAVRVRTVGMTATICLATSEHPEAPAPGQVVAGTCWLVVDVPSLWGVDVGALHDLAPRRRKGRLRARFSRAGRGDAPD